MGRLSRKRAMTAHEHRQASVTKEKTAREEKCTTRTTFHFQTWQAGDFKRQWGQLSCSAALVCTFLQLTASPGVQPVVALFRSLPLHPRLSARSLTVSSEAPSTLYSAFFSALLPRAQEQDRRRHKQYPNLRSRIFTSDFASSFCSMPELHHFETQQSGREKTRRIYKFGLPALY